MKPPASRPPERGQTQRPPEGGQTRYFADRVVLPALLAGLVAWLVTPDPTPAIVARGALGWSLVAAGIAASLSRRRYLHVAAAVIFAFAAEHLLFSPGMPRGHDFPSHSWGTWAFFQAVADGDTTPQWLHHLSLGLPLPLFYSPATYYSMTPFYWLGLTPMEILKGGFIAFAVLGTVAMYFVAGRWTGSSRAGLVAAAAYAFAPYRLLDSHYRLALAECAALAVLPWIFWLFFGPGGWSRRRIAAAAVATAVLITAHPLSVLTLGVVGLLWQGIEILTEGLSRGFRRRLGKRILAALLGLAAAGFYVVPMACRLSSVSVTEGAVRQGSDEAPLARQGLRWSQPLKRLPWTDLAQSQARGAPKDADGQEMPHYLGWGLFACALLAGAHGARRLRDGSSPAPELVIALVALGALALTFHASATVLAHLPLLPKLQFAWRFLGPASFAAALAAGFVARSLITARRAPFVALLTMLLVADAFPYTGAADWAPAVDGFAHFYVSDPQCGRRWGCWESEQIARPLPRRVFGTFQPPSRFGEDVAHVRPGYGEYLNPQALRRIRSRRGDAGWAGLGVSLRGHGIQGTVAVLDPAPYAQWYPSAATRPRPLEFQRQAARIDVELPHEKGRLVVLEQYLPGWTATVDGDPAAIEPTPEGLIQVPIPTAGSRAELRFRLRGADVLAGRAATFLALAMCLFLVWRRNPEP